MSRPMGIFVLEDTDAADGANTSLIHVVENWDEKFRDRAVAEIVRHDDDEIREFPAFRLGAEDGRQQDEQDR